MCVPPTMPRRCSGIQRPLRQRSPSPASQFATAEPRDCVQDQLQQRMGVGMDTIPTSIVPLPPAHKSTRATFLCGAEFASTNIKFCAAREVLLQSAPPKGAAPEGAVAQSSLLWHLQYPPFSPLLGYACPSESAPLQLRRQAQGWPPCTHELKKVDQWTVHRSVSDVPLAFGGDSRSCWESARKNVPLSNTRPTHVQN